MCSKKLSSSKKPHLIETHTSITHMKNKEQNYMIYLACNSMFEFQTLTNHKKYQYLPVYNLFLKKKKRLAQILSMPLHYFM